MSGSKGGFLANTKIHGWIGWAWDSAVSVLRNSLHVDTSLPGKTFLTKCSHAFKRRDSLPSEADGTDTVFHTGGFCTDTICALAWPWPSNAATVASAQQQWLQIFGSTAAYRGCSAT